jgi:hypothetical protein
VRAKPGDVRRHRRRGRLDSMHASRRTPDPSDNDEVNPR